MLEGHDFDGLPWAIQSFNQLVTNEDGQPKVRLAAVRDWPDAPGKRGYTAFRDDDNTTAAWFAVNCLRANVVLYRQIRKPADWRGRFETRSRSRASTGATN